MITRRQDNRSPTEQAARWINALQRDRATEHEAFAAWLRESPQNIREYLILTALEKEIGEIDLSSFDVDQLRAEASNNVVHFAPAQTAARSEHEPPDSRAVGARRPIGKPFPRARWRWVTGMAAVAAALVVTIGWVLIRTGAIGAEQYATAIGEQRTLELRDGSIVQLNPLSRVQVRYTGSSRELRLLEGEAIFDVEHDSARPFRVTVGPTVIEAVGTQFQVHRRASGTVLAVIEGAVEVAPSNFYLLPIPRSSTTGTAAPAGRSFEPLREPVRVTAGEEARIAADGSAMRRSTLEATHASSWRQRYLIFSGDTLADIAEDFNRYNRAPQLRIEGETLRTRRFSGRFDADDPESLVEYLRQSELIDVSYDEGQIVLRAR